MRKYLYLSAVCVCMALCFVGCSKDDDEPGGKGAMYEVTIEQSGDFRSFIKSVVVVANGTQLKDGATGESLASPVILSDEERYCLIQKLEERNQNYADNRNFQIIIENITKS